MKEIYEAIKYWIKRSGKESSIIEERLVFIIREIFLSIICVHESNKITGVYRASWWSVRLM